MIMIGYSSVRHSQRPTFNSFGYFFSILIMHETTFAILNDKELNGGILFLILKESIGSTFVFQNDILVFTLSGRIFLRGHLRRIIQIFEI